MNARLGTFKYFLECYFNVSANYDELTLIIKEFNSGENTKYRKQLYTELSLIEQQEDWDMIREFVRKHGGRKMDEERLKWFIHELQYGIEVS
ncbi:hypothetical protein [Sporomusa malonica]|uniref:CdiI immunity protein domain-containing protein n=1 Tax=Sporomusa malonica TaxID=112901 RepID=A0A1W2E272_9FIRM|nr:hypothetical protein [Sporomusa malonica]SMD03924.1 hypothetical protein SAMN04488500_1202 [Sporomusa malonica]